MWLTHSPQLRFQTQRYSLIKSIYLIREPTPYLGIDLLAGWLNTIQKSGS
jgi:hypothetical protein